MESQAFRYRMLCSIKIEHEAFNKQSLENYIYIKASLATQNFMNLNGLKMQTGEGNFMIFCRTKMVVGQEKRPLYTIKGAQLDFVFNLKNQANSALPKRDNKHYVFGNKKAFDAGLSSENIFLPPLSAATNIADEIVKDGIGFKLAFTDYGNAANPPPLALVAIDSGDYASTSNLELLVSPDQFPISQKDTGLIRILLDDHNVLGNTYKLLLANGDISTKEYSVKIKSKS